MGCAGSQGSASSLWISRDVFAVRCQHPCGFQGMFLQSGVSMPVDFMRCFGSQGSASLWISWDVLAVIGQQPYGFQGMFWQSGVSILVDFKGCFHSQGSAHYRGPGGSTGSQGSASLWISWDVLAVKGQYPCRFHVMFWQSGVSIPVDFMGCFGSQGSTTLPRGQHWQSGVSILMDFMGCVGSQSGVSIPVDFKGCFHSQGSASLWIS